MNIVAFILIACFVFGFGLVSRRLAVSPLTPPLVFVVDVSGAGLARRYGAIAADRAHCAEEHQEVMEHPLRMRS
jgi:hypothetical protein